MAAAETEVRAIWGVHMDASVGSKAIDENLVAIGWPQVGDLSGLADNREAFKAAIEAAAIPHAKPGGIPVWAGILYRFVHKVRTGDYVVYPSKHDRMVNIGRIAGAYRHDPALSADYPNVRPVEWLKHLPRDEFSQEALYEMGSFVTLFTIRNHAEEFLAALDASPKPTPVQDEDERRDDATVSKDVAQQAEETTQDFVIRTLKTQIDAYQFEGFVAHLLECMGYHARVTPKSGDGGVDVIAHRDQLGFEPPIIKVQCKQITGAIGRPEVTQLVGNVEQGEHGLFVTLGTYTREARDLGRSKPNLRLIGGEQLTALVFENYHRFAPRFQAILPLKQIFVPSLGDGE